MTNPCTRCGAKFTTNHLQRCKAVKEQRRSCGGNGHFARMCRRANPTNQRENGNFRGNNNTAQIGGMRRINLIDQANKQSENSTEDDAENMILQVGGNRTPPFVLKGKINNVAFTTMIDSGSPIPIFTQGDLREILKKDVLFARPIPNGEEYVDYNGRPLKLLGFTTVDVKVGKKEIKKARVVITRDGKKSLIGRDWLTSLNFRVADINNLNEYNNSLNNINSNNKEIEKIKLSPELKRIEQKFAKSFSRQGKIVGHMIQTEVKEGAKATQQK